jgi:hypothetical protein
MPEHNGSTSEERITVVELSCILSFLAMHSERTQTTFYLLSFITGLRGENVERLLLI